MGGKVTIKIKKKRKNKTSIGGGTKGAVNRVGHKKVSVFIV